LAATGGFQQEPGQHKTNLTASTRSLNDLYVRVRKLRESGARGTALLSELTQVHERLESEHREDWLLRFSLLELAAAQKLQASWEDAIRKRLSEIASSSAEKSRLISRGLALL
jgi:hypothetical protein